MKHIVLIFITLLFTLFEACTKNEVSVSGKGTVAKIIPLPPPFGYTFPQTYVQKQKNTDFHVWINSLDRTTSFTPQFFFKDSLNIPDFNIRLNSFSSLDILTGGQVVSSAGYFFYNDTLFVINNGSLGDTSPFANGNYNAFTLTESQFHLHGEDAFSTVSISQSRSFYTTKDAILKMSEYSIFKIDTLAIYNYGVIFQ